MAWTKYFSFIIILLLVISCTQNIKEPEDGKFDRQLTEISTDDMIIGDDLNFWDTDAPRGVLFFPQEKVNFLRGLGIKPLRFKEKDKSFEEINTLIETEQMYIIEIYETKDKSLVLDPKSPDICTKITDNFYKFQLIYQINKAYFRVKERNLVPIGLKVDKDSFIFIRIGIGEPFSVLPNKAIDGFWINAKKSEKQWEDFSPLEKKKITAWTCQEFDANSKRSFEPLYYNADIVFNYD